MCNTSRIQVKVMFMRHITVWCCPLPGSDYRFLMDSHRERCCTWPKYDAAKIASACNNMMKFDTLLPKVNIGGVVLVTFWKWSIKEVLKYLYLFQFDPHDIWEFIKLLFSCKWDIKLHSNDDDNCFFVDYHILFDWVLSSKVFWCISDSL